MIPFVLIATLLVGAAISWRSPGYDSRFLAAASLAGAHAGRPNAAAVGSDSPASIWRLMAALSG